MLLKKNLLETLTVVCCSGTIFCMFLHSITNISPITGIWFPIYLVFLFLISVVLSFKILKWLLSLNKPIKYDLNNLVVRYPILNGLMGFLPDVFRGSSRAPITYKEYDTNELSVISTVLERKLVSSWYVPYISQEIGFPFACKQLLDQMIGKAFQISHKMETKDIYLGVCTICITHLREYRRALKRKEKSPNAHLEQLYKKSHSIFKEGKKISSGDYSVKILRVICKELVPWELWDTPHSELLIRILTKQLDSYINDTLTNPVWLNDKLVKILLNQCDGDSKLNDSEINVTDSENLINKEEISSPEKTEDVIAVDITQILEPTVVNITEKLLNAPSDVTKTDNSDLSLPLDDIHSETVLNGKTVSNEVKANGTGDAIVCSEPLDIQKSPVLRQRRGRQGKGEVKIYDRIVEGSVKTWETEMDLRCISLGQDLLASLDGEMTMSRLWELDADPDGSPNPPRKSPQELWFGEEYIIDQDAPTTPKSPRKPQSPKASDLLLKDLASTVSTAKNKIGDLQVDSLSSTRSSGDEAAGMMEGLLDFGIAGIKKGLRFTGLSDSQEKDKSPTHQHKEILTRSKSSPMLEEIIKGNSELNGENQKEQNMAIPILQKQPRVSSQDSVAIQKREGCVAPDSLSTSPDPQYEEVTDLSTSIAKLRSLLQARSNDEIMWEGAEETRGRPARHNPLRTVDSATKADEYDMNADRISPPNQMSNNMQRLDKLLHRTVTGVFNSLRTAVGADNEAAPESRSHWTYVTTSMDHTVMGAVSRLVHCRRAHSHVDAALDSLEQLSHASPREGSPTHSDHFEEWCVCAGSGGGGAGAVLAAAFGCARLTHTALTALLHDLLNPLITEWLEGASQWLREQIFRHFELVSKSEGHGAHDEELRHLDLDYTCQLIMEKLPGTLTVFGEDTLRETVKLITSSLSHKEINRDLAFRLLDVFAVHFKNAASLRNPSFES